MRKLFITLLAAFAAAALPSLAQQTADPLEGKVVNVIGDSYVRNHRRPCEESWHALVAKRHGMTYNNYGRNGGCVAFDRTKSGFGPSLLVRYRDMSPDADAVIIIAGHNDAGFVGHSADTLAMFADSLDLLLTRIEERCPKARIGYVTPWNVGREGFKEVCSAIRKVCRRHRVPVLDNYKKSCAVKVRDAEFRKKYFQGPDDTAHLNAAGHELYYPVGEKFVMRLLGAD